MTLWAWILIERGYGTRRAGRSADAHRLFTQAVAVSRRVGSSAVLVRALKGLGQIERDHGNGDAALPLYEEAVRICRAEGGALRLAHTVRHLGDIHQDAARFDLAEPCYREALAIYRCQRRTNPLDLANAVRPFAIRTLRHSRRAVDTTNRTLGWLGSPCCPHWG
jgi:tetratricopeptide (TPR) repeat protein